MKSSRALSCLLMVALLSLGLIRPAGAQSLITIGDPNLESLDDSGNGNLVFAQAVALAQSATIVSLSFYVTQASGTLILGLYDATGIQGHPGKLLAATSSFVTTNGWNATNVVTPVLLAAGNYWLAYLPSSSALSFLKQNDSGSCVYKGQTFSKGMPATFATSTSNCSPTTWSFYATVVPSGGGTIVNGVCGSSNGATLASAPTANLCSAGAASSVTGTGPWNWTCVGSGGGTAASCSAQLQSSAVAPTITTQPQNQSVTVGAKATFTVVASGTAPLSYQWSKNGAAIAGATKASFTTPATVSGDNGSTFSVHVSNTAGSTMSNVATLTVTSVAPTITTQPQNQSVTAGAKATFTVVASGTAPLNYQWSKNGAAIAGATKASYTTPATVSGDNGSTFTVTVSNGAGSQTSNAASLTVTSVAPTITTQPRNQSVTVGAKATFSVVASGTAPLGYQWSKNGAAIAGAISASYTTPTTVSGDSGSTFSVQVGNAAGSTTSNAATLTVTGVAPTITTQPKSQSVTAGATANFIVVASGTAPLSYQWSKNAAAIAGATSASFTTPATVSGDNGSTFTVQVSNAVGSKTSNAATLTVTSVAPTITTQPQNQSVTAGATATFIVVASGTAPLGYQWSKNGAAIAGATGASYTTPATVSGDNGSTFSVQVSNAAGSKTSNPATLTVNPSSSVTVTVSPRRAGLTTSEPQTFTATVTGDPDTAVTWSVDGIANGSSTVGVIGSNGVYMPPSTAGVHTVTATSVASPGNSASSSVAVTDLVGVATQRYDSARTGQNLSEYALTTTAVGTPGAFGELFNCAIEDGPIYAQPLYVANLAIAGGTHNVLFVATQQNTVYAFDADVSSCVIYWVVSLDPTGGSSVPNAAIQGDGDINGPYGIFGTPVIDLAGGVLYAVAASQDSDSSFKYRLHALNLTTGTEMPSSPAVISATVSGVAFDPSVHMQRPALLLVGSTVFVSFGSFGDANTYYGWVMGYDKTALSQVAAFNTAPDSTESTGAAIWMAGAGPAADSDGNIYFSTANGPFNVSNTLPPVSPNDNFGDTLLKLTSSLTVADFFTPVDQANLDSSDLDLGSGGVMVLPDAAGSTTHPHLAIASDKESNLYLVDRDNMGMYNSSINTNVQTVLVNNSGGDSTTGIFSTASYWNGNVYIGAVGDNVKLYPIANAQLATSPVAQSTENYGYPGTNVAISAAGPSASSAVAWALDTNASGTETGGAARTGPAILRAYDATSLGAALWSSSAKSTDTCGNAVKFAVPTIANGKVYVAGTNQITVYGLLP